MKRFALLLFALVGAVGLANAQMIRPSGVVKQTRVKIEREKTTIGVWSDEVGRITHSVGALASLDYAGLDYTAQYRLSPLLSVGAGIWGGYGDWYDDKIGVELRANVRVHPLALFKSESQFQPYVSVWAGYITPNLWIIYNGGNQNGGKEWGHHPFALTFEAGCDAYKWGRPLFLSFNLNMNTFDDYDEEYWLFGAYLKGGIKF